LLDRRVAIQLCGGHQRHERQEQLIQLGDVAVAEEEGASVLGIEPRRQIVDYLASGLDPENGRTFFFSHSHIPELNQLLLPFMSLVTTAELDRNPTVKEEIRAAGLRQVNALMYTYPIHQAA